MHTTSPSPTDEGSSRVALRFFFKQKTAYEIIGVTGVQTCALPISAADGSPTPAGSPLLDNLRASLLAAGDPRVPVELRDYRAAPFILRATLRVTADHDPDAVRSSEERRVGKEGRSRWSPDHYKKKT